MEILTSERHIKESSGASMCGSKSGSWRAWWADAIATAEIYRIYEHNARTEAEMSEMNKP